MPYQTNTPEFMIELERCIPALRRYAFTLYYKRDEADDLVQDCLERALKKQMLWKKNTSLRAWLFTMQHNIFVNQFRKQSRRPELVSDIDSLTHPMELDQSDILMRDIDYCIRHLS